MILGHVVHSGYSLLGNYASLCLERKAMVELDKKSIGSILYNRIL